MYVICQFCHSLNFAAEQPSNGKFKNCCQKGKARLPYHHEFLPLLEEVMTNPQHMFYENFQTNILSFNSSLSFAFWGAKIISISGQGPYCFHVHGQFYHPTPHLQPRKGDARSCSQLKILDPNEAAEEQLNHPQNLQCNPTLIQGLDALLRNFSLFSASYKMVR